MFSSKTYWHMLFTSLARSVIISIRTTGAVGAGAPPEILALSKISNKYVANTDIFYHMIQMTFVPDLFIEIHIS